MDDGRDEVAEAVAKVLNEAGGVDVPHGEHYDALLALILDELSVQLQMYDVDVSPETVAHIAGFIAVEVDYAFTLAPRDFQPLH
jgi:hypothetical protein